MRAHRRGKPGCDGRSGVSTNAWARGGAKRNGNDGILNQKRVGHVHGNETETAIKSSIENRPRPQSHSETYRKRIGKHEKEHLTIMITFAMLFAVIILRPYTQVECD